MKSLLIVYHSQSGSTERLAWAAWRAASGETETRCRILRAMEAGSADLEACDGVILATPENFGALSGGMKDFLDRSFYAISPLRLNLPCALMVCAGNDGTGALGQLRRIVRGYPLREVAEALLVRGEPAQADLDRAADIGLSLAAGLAMGIF